MVHQSSARRRATDTYRKLTPKECLCFYDKTFSFGKKKWAPHFDGYKYTRQYTMGEFVI
jgi:hypothetical protein